jgi:hypothetical protein
MASYIRQRFSNTLSFARSSVRTGVSQMNAFIVPPPGIPGYDLQHAPVYIAGSVEELKWETTFKTLTLIFSQFNGMAYDTILGSCSWKSFLFYDSQLNKGPVALTSKCYKSVIV